MIISKMKDGKTIYKSWRENGEKKFEMVDFRPYFFVSENHKEPSTYNASKSVIGLILNDSL